MKYHVYMKRNDRAPAVKLESFADRTAAERYADVYRRDYPYAAIEVRQE